MANLTEPNRVGLVACFIAWVMEEAERNLKGTTEDWIDQFIFNFAAPLDQVESWSARDVFTRTFYLAGKLKGRVSNEIQVQDAMRLFTRASEEYPTTPPDSERAEFVVPEAISALFSYCKSPATANGLYALVDIGAGTTNVSFFRFSRTATRPVAFYASRTAVVGADDIDRQLAELAVERFPAIASLRKSEILHMMRVAKQSWRDGDLRLRDGQAIAASKCSNSIQAVLERIYRTYREAFGRAYLKEKRADHWTDLTIILTGGGSQIPGIERVFAARPHDIVGRVNVVRATADPRTFSELSSQVSSPEIRSLLAVVYGLSFPRLDIPNYWSPDDVDPLPPPPPPPEPPDRDELYPP